MTTQEEVESVFIGSRGRLPWDSMREHVVSNSSLPMIVVGDGDCWGVHRKAGIGLREKTKIEYLEIAGGFLGEEV